MEDSLKIHLFTDEVVIENEIDILTSFLESGLDYLHIRKPGCSIETSEEIIKNIPNRFHPQIILHDHYSLSQRYGCGVQYNQRNGCDNFPPHSGTTSFSCHSIRDIFDHKNMDFVTLSPIFDSISKPGYKSKIEDLSLHNLDLSNTVALGGITIQALDEIEKMGFGGAALLGDVWRKKDGVGLFLKYLRLRNLSFQFITDGKNPQATITQALAFLKGGGKWIQVRMKYAPKEGIASVLKRLLPACQRKGATLIVDDHVELAELCHGVHLGQNDTPVETARNMLSKDKIIGLTVNNASQIEKSRDNLPDYYGVGPFRFTSTKKNLSPVLGFAGYRVLSPLLPRKFVAIGGITTEDIPNILDTGATGVAVSALITKSLNPIQETKNIIKIINGKR